MAGRKSHYELGNFSISIDSKEKVPYEFKNAVRKGLETGDYSIDGLEHLITIERKTKADAYGSLGGGRRERLRREFQRMAQLDSAHFIVECSLSDFLVPPKPSKLNPKSALNTLLAWSNRYRVHIHFADDRRHAMALTRQLLEHFYRQLHEKSM